MGRHCRHVEPFVSHAFLRALEVGGATGGDSGWDPMHLVLRDAEGGSPPRCRII